MGSEFTFYVSMLFGVYHPSHYGFLHTVILHSSNMTKVSQTPYVYSCRDVLAALYLYINGLLSWQV